MGLHFLFYFIFVFMVALMAYGGSQARGPIRAVATGLHHGSSESELHLQPTPQLTAMPDHGSPPSEARDQTHILMDVSQVR